MIPCSRGWKWKLLERLKIKHPRLSHCDATKSGIMLSLLASKLQAQLLVSVGCGPTKSEKKNVFSRTSRGRRRLGQPGVEQRRRDVHRQVPASAHLRGCETCFFLADVYSYELPLWLIHSLSIIITWVVGLIAVENFHACVVFFRKGGRVAIPRSDYFVRMCGAKDT